MKASKGDIILGIQEEKGLLRLRND